MRVVAFAVALIASWTVANGQEVATICLSSGQTYQIGDIACIPACHGRQRLAKCELKDGAAAWTTVADACPSAKNLILQRARAWLAAFSLASTKPLRIRQSRMVPSQTPL